MLHSTVVVGLAFDIIRDSSRSSGFAPAEEHLGSFEPQYAHARLEGFAAMLRLGFTDRLVIPGKDERRLKHEHILLDGKRSPIWQGYAIREMLIKDLGCDARHIKWLQSTGTTNDAAIAARNFLRDNDIPLCEGSFEFVTSWYHCTRSACISMRMAGVPPHILPAESFTLALAETEGARSQAEDRLRSFGGHYLDSRVIAEIRGISDHLLGRYESKKTGW